MSFSLVFSLLYYTIFLLNSRISLLKLHLRSYLYNSHHDRLSREHVDGPGEARRFLSPYDIPLPIEGRCVAVDDLLRAGHVTVIRLPLDGGRGGSVQEATASVKAQLEGLLDLATTLFLPRLKALVEIEGERSVVTRTVDMDDALDESGRGRRQTVSISRTGPTRDEDTTGRFWVWTRGLGGASDPEWADRIRGAVRHLPNKWPDVDRAEVGVAVREGLESAEGRFVIFLPTEMATGTGAHINAPFFGSLDRRRIDFRDEYNTLLLGCVADLCLDAVGDLLAGEPEDVRGQAVVDILGARGEVGGTGQSMLELVRDRSAARNTAIEDRAQTFSGTNDCAANEADVVLYSFGPIKTCTAVGGALAMVRDGHVLRVMRKVQDSYPAQSRVHYLQRILKYCLLKAISGRISYALFYGICRCCCIDHDHLISCSARSFGERAFSPLSTDGRHRLCCGCSDGG